MLNLWYKNAVVYCLDVETFMDADGDGIGDFKGLADRLDHVEALGATCLWLLPFYPSPNRDNGYDVSDFYSVDPRYGSLGDFVNFCHAARDRGLRIIVDLVVNHTSLDHPWFQSARSSPDSPYRDWYVWSKERPADADQGVVFPGYQDGIWSYDEAAGAWYLHRFYAHQADLNITNPLVRDEIEKIMGFWLQLGVDGFRIDAVPFLVEYLGVEKPPERDPRLLLEDMRNFLCWRKAEAMMLAEANITMDEADDYFGPNGERMHVILNFPLNQQLFLAFARRDAEPLRAFLRAMPKLPPQAQWGIFLRNHDELDLGRLSPEEREEVYAAFGPETSMQLYDRGIRRRVAAMFDGDQARLKLAYSLLLALPGTPVVWHGDEIGMGDDLGLPERNAVRTPLQWSDEPNGGFSTAAPERVVRPVIADGPFGYRSVNIAAQRGRDGSLLDMIQHLVRARRASPEIGWGDCRVLDLGPSDVLALEYRWRDGFVLTLHNFSDHAVELDVAPIGRGRLTSLLERGADRLIDGATTLPPYGFAWLRTSGERR